MREIKFRAKRTDNNDWVRGDLMHTSSVSAGYNLDIYINSHRGFNYKVRKETIGQFTGLYDMDGKEIYEGDIIFQRTYHGMSFCEVRFESGAFIVGYHEGSSTKRTPMLIQEGCIIVGNIYDCNLIKAIYNENTDNSQAPKED